MLLLDVAYPYHNLAYDGASNMSGIRNRTQALFKQEET